MKQNRQKQLSRGGFTLIEVVLVLAIGGLIFLLAFIAFQQVSTNRRDTQRRNDAGRVIAELQNAAGDGIKVTSQTLLTGSATPSTTDTSTNNSFLKAYLGNGLEGPSEKYKFIYATTGAISVAANDITVGYGVECAANSNSSFAAKSGSYAVVMGLEKGSVCRDDQ
ncbi:type II secretion system protein [Candidatus Saccharibacteria bacterium]|jgi:prepilin-type N-terminal cleavage/methylation domain-containing protein|nr:type II secretion system protein [Candidatus Saccharibacteria bacterium]